MNTLNSASKVIRKPEDNQKKLASLCLYLFLGGRYEMLKYIVLENSRDYVTYRYFPEGKENYGEITVRKVNKQIIEKKILPNDEAMWYLFKMYSLIRAFIDSNTFESDGVITWC